MPANVTGKMTGTREHARDKPRLSINRMLARCNNLGTAPSKLKGSLALLFGIVDQIGASKEVGVLPPITECGRLLQLSQEKLYHDAIVELVVTCFVFDPGRPGRLAT